MEYVTTQPTPPDYTILFKQLDNCQTEGCSLLVWRPSNVVSAKDNKVPVFIYIHGGAFTAGAATSSPYAQFKYWLERGVAVVSLEYRLIPHVLQYDCRKDVLDGYLFVQRDLNRELENLGAGFQIDTTRCISAGASAGGTLCVNLGTDILGYNDTCPESDRVPQLRAVVSAYPLVDPNTQMIEPRSKYAALETEDPKLYAMAQSVLQEPVCTGIPFKFPLDDTIPRWAWFKATFATKSHNSFLFGCDAPYPPSTCATTGIRPDSPPTYILAAMSDEQIPVKNSFILRDKLQEVGVEVHVGEARDAFHGFTVMLDRQPEKGLVWWEEAIFPGLEWARSKIA